MRILIIDDEMLSRANVREHLSSSCEGIEWIDEAGSVREAVTLIAEKKPDLVFLDIEMPEEDGFALFSYIPSPDFHTVFVTAHDQHALRAFRVSAADYILKPVKTEQLVKTVSRIQKQVAQKPDIAAILKALKSDVEKRLSISTAEGLFFVNVNDVEALKADDSYTHLFTSEGKKYTISKKLKHYDELLEPYFQFLRVHRSFIVNANYILSYNKGLQVLITRSGMEIPVSRERKLAVEAYIADYFL